MLLIPSIDLRGGRCVRLYQGVFDAEKRYEPEPQEVLRHYASIGAAWVHVVDLDGVRFGSPANRELVHTLVAAGAVKLQVAGGLRTATQVGELLARGADRVVVGSAAIEKPGAVIGWLERFGAERMCLAFDVRLDHGTVPHVYTRGWTWGTTHELWREVEAFRAHGLKHVLCTDIERDGTLRGPNLALYQEAVRRFPDVAWQASGGVRDAADLAALATTGVAAAISGKAMLEGRMTSEELRPFLPVASSPVSTSRAAPS